MSDTSEQKSIAEEPVHIFDQTNGLMPKEDDDAVAHKKKHEPTDEEIAQGTFTVAYGARGTTF